MIHRQRSPPVNEGMWLCCASICRLLPEVRANRMLLMTVVCAQGSGAWWTAALARKGGRLRSRWIQTPPPPPPPPGVDVGISDELFFERGEMHGAVVFAGRRTVLGARAGRGHPGTNGNRRDSVRLLRQPRTLQDALYSRRREAVRAVRSALPTVISFF